MRLMLKDATTQWFMMMFYDMCLLRFCTEFLEHHVQHDYL